MSRGRREFEAYEMLPEAIRAVVTREEYKWLSDNHKATIVEEFTMPEHDAEDPAQ